MSNSELYYLREDAYFEPLFNQWYAWIYLMSPVAAARHTVHTHKRIMKSFINNYQLHMLAVNQPGMEGSEFMDCKEEQLPEIKDMVKFIDQDLSDVVELSDAVKHLDTLLRNHIRGQSIEPLYSQIPEPLKGFVEIFVDMEHNPSFRLFESLLYKSKHYKPQLQTVSFGLLSEVHERPFCFSTPRMADENHIQLKLNFSSTVLDELLSSRTKPISMSRIDEIFSEFSHKGGLDYRKLFTTEPSVYQHQAVTGEGIRLQYLGHAGLMIESSSVSILIDPVIASRSAEHADQIISFTQLPQKIDYIFLTHSHQDHACLETLLQLRHCTDTIVVPRNNGGTLVDPSLKIMLKELRFNVVEVDELEQIDFAGGSCTSLPFVGEHGDLNIRSKTAWIIELNGKKIFAGADTSNLDPAIYEHIHQLFGDLDILAIGMECVGAPYTWIYGALCSSVVPQKIKNSRRLNGSDAEQAYQLVQIFNPKKVYLYALGMEPWYKYFMGIEYDENSTQIVESNKFIDMCKGINVDAECLYGKMDTQL